MSERLSYQAGQLKYVSNGTYTFYISRNANYVSFNGNTFIGSIDNVSVVEDLSGDFQFSRNSAATRVNAQGLVENVQIISSELVSNGNFSQIGTEEVSNGNFSQEGSELVTNGDFSNGTTDWTPNASATLSIDTGRLKIAISGEASGYAKQDIFTIESGKQYKCTGTVDFGTASQMRFYVSNTGQFFDITQSGNFNFTFTSTGTSTQIRLYTYGDGNYGFWDNISVKEVGQDWNLGTGWSIGEDKAICDGTNNADITQVGSIVGKTYKATLSVSENNVGRVNVYIGGTFAGQTTNGATGDFTFYATATDTNLIRIRSNNSFNGSVTNISVKEVGQDWTFGSGWSVDQANSKATCDGTQTSTSTLQTAQGISNIQNDLVKLSFEIKDYSAGAVSVTLQGTGGIEFNNLAANGVYEINITSTDSLPRLLFNANSSFVGSVTNISVKEITDDTDLPRINYEGFSYQDSLGSEEIVNGDFSNGSANWGNYTSGSSTIVFTDVATLNVDASNSNVGIYQENVFASGKQYKVVLRIKASSSFDAEVLETQGAVTISTIGSVSLTTSYQDFTFYFTGTGTNDIFIHRKFSSPSANQSITIDNVSVKEYLGQEVVPDSGCGSWLLEPQSTNLITHSSDLTPWWSVSGATIENTSIVSPDGTQNVKSVKTSSTGTYQGIFKAEASAFADKTLTLSAFAKKSNNDYIFFYNIGGVQGNQGVWFNISDGTIGTNSSGWTNTKIENYGNGWYRCSSTLTFAASGQDYIYIQNSNSDNNINSDINKETYIWGTQLEEQSYVTSYIPTNGATNTRLQDIANNSGNSTLINSTEGVLYAEIAALADDGTNRIISLFEDGNINNRVNMFYTSGSNKMKFVVRVNGSNVFDDTITLSNILGYNKVALKYKENDFAIYINGVKEVEQLSGSTYPSNTLDKLNFNQGSGSFPFYGKNKALAVYKEALVDANLRCLTYPNPVATTFDLDFDTIAEQFTFTRGSEATFVNEQGLIESTNQIGPELVTNGDFATDSDWILTTGSNISDGKLNAFESAYTFFARQLNVVTIGKQYKVTFDVDIQGGNGVLVYLSDSNAFGIIQTSGTHTFYLTADGSQIRFRAYDQGFIGSIDNVSVKEVTTATNTPRIDYSTGEKAFLLEPQSTNYSTNSEQPSTWHSSGGVIVTPNAATSPEGLQNSSLVVNNASSGARYARNLFNFSSGSGLHTVTVSYFIKYYNNQWVRLKSIFFNGSPAADQSTYFDVQNGVLGTVGANHTAKIKDYGNGWYRCSITFDIDKSVDSNGYVHIEAMDSDNSNTYAANGQGFYAYGSQGEELSYPTSYIPTGGAIATRNQELCNNATPVINSEEGTLYAEISALADDGNVRMLSISDGSTNNSVSVEYSVLNNLIRIRLRSGNVEQSFYQSTNYDFLQYHKIALSYKLNDFKIYIDGVLIHTDTSLNTPINLSELSFSNGTGGNKFFGNTKGLKYYPKALADVQLEDLTTI